MQFAFRHSDRGFTLNWQNSLFSPRQFCVLQHFSILVIFQCVITHVTAVFDNPICFLCTNEQSVKVSWYQNPELIKPINLQLRLLIVVKILFSSDIFWWQVDSCWKAKYFRRNIKLLKHVLVSTICEVPLLLE